MKLILRWSEEVYLRFWAQTGLASPPYSAAYCDWPGRRVAQFLNEANRLMISMPRKSVMCRRGLRCIRIAQWGRTPRSLRLSKVIQPERWSDSLTESVCWRFPNGRSGNYRRECRND